MLTKDIVTQNHNAGFVNDVQLGWYPADPRNKDLARSYIFTRSALKGYYSSVDLLEMLCQAFLWGKENRRVGIATYGHGKTRLALALANFFGQPEESEEFQGILASIDHTAGPQKAAALLDFKRGHPSFLVTRLHGDQPQGLPQQFLTGLESALREHEATRTERLPFWFESAEQFLAGLSGQELEKANACLAERGLPLDVAALLDRVRKRDSTTYDLCRDISRSVYGAPLDFGGEVSLEEAITWAADTFTGEGKPLAGILVLFDEFSAFIQRYAERRDAGSAASLQDLLKGVENRHGRVVFVAFSQHDPDTVADNIYRRTGDEEGHESLRKELERLPQQQRHSLYSSLEVILQSYLKKDPDGWDALYQQAMEAIEDATDYTMQLFPERYDSQAGWGVERVSEVLTTGCFPLHPLTTAILCNTEFQEVSSPRSVLGFVFQALNDRLDQPAVVDGVPNWIYPTELIGWFGEMLAGKEYEDYLSVRQQVGPDASPVQVAVLGAVMLQTVGQLKTRRIGFPRVVSLLCGYAEAECEEALEALSSGGYIRHDPVQDSYGFWPAGAGGDRLEKEILARIQRKRLDAAVLDRLHREWREKNKGQTPRLAPIPMDSCQWGHEEDYAAAQYLLTRSMFVPQTLRALTPGFRLDASKGLVAADRSCVVWLVAERDEDVAWFRANAAPVLDEAFGGDAPLPVVLAVPTDARPHFARQVLREMELKDLKPDECREYGSQVMEDARRRYAKDVDDEWGHLRRSPEFVVPAAYRGAVQAQAPLTGPKHALRICYELAYRSSPPAFFTQYRVTNPSLRKAVNLVARHLATNTLASAEQALKANSVASDLMKKFLRQGGGDSWGLVTHEDSIRVPASARVLRAWEHLDETFAPGKGAVPVRDALIPLLNPLYGYDYNHATLLFCAWYGYNRHDLEMQVGSRACSLDDFFRFLDRPEEFIGQLCSGSGVRLARRDRDAVTQEIVALISRVNAGALTEEDAESIHSRLVEFDRNDANDPNVRQSAGVAAERVRVGLEKAREYRKAAEGILQTVRAAVSVKELARQIKKVQQLPTLGCVAVGDDLSVAEVRKQGFLRLYAVVEAHCRKFEQLPELEDHKHHDAQLRLIRPDLEDLGDQKLLSRVDQAIQELLKQRGVLEARQKDAAIVIEVNAIQPDGRLAILRGNLERLDGFEPGLGETSTLIEHKRAQLQQAIQAAERFAAEVPGRVDGLTTTAQARQLQDDIQRRYDRYEGTPQVAVMDAALARCTSLEACFQRLDALREAFIGTPQDAEALMASVVALQQEVSGPLSGTQAVLFTQAIAKIESRLAAKRNDALAWLDRLGQQFEEGRDLEGLSRALTSTHPFLAPEHTDRVLRLRQRVQQRLEEDDYATVLRHFKRITNREKRDACLKALLELVRELEEG